MTETVNAYRADPYDYAEARALAEALELSEPVAITLVRRGYRTPEEARAFLDADETHPPGDFGSMAAIVEQVREAVRAGQRITVHGDFDVDGVCATTIMVATLRELGAECDWLIPDRLADGYGLDAENIRRLAERGTALLITVDCGITAVEEVALARSLGIDVIVTDHHQPAGELPDCPILHPEIDGYPFTDLCGTAVAWKLSIGPEGRTRISISISSRWRRWPTWCRWSGRTGRSCGGDWRRFGGRSGPGSVPCWPRPRSSLPSSMRGTWRFGWRRGSTRQGAFTGPMQGWSCSSPRILSGQPRSPPS